MAYWKDVWHFSGSNEYEYKFAGNYGAKGEKRTPKKKATPEQIKKQNQSNREKKIRRLIKANFKKNDLWATLKYPAGYKEEPQAVKRDIKKFLDKLRRIYKKAGILFKYIYRIEVGKKGGVHIHILINRISNVDIDVIIQSAWEKGRVNFQAVYEAGGFKKLAEYIVKQPTDEVAKQLSLFPEEEQKEFIKYSCSRNLIRPQPERSIYSRRTVRKLIEEGPKATLGYYIDQDSIVFGTNPYTGMSYYHYTEVIIAPVQPKARGDDIDETG